MSGRAGNAQAMVWWNPPASNGGSPITSYTITSSPSGGSVTAATAAKVDYDAILALK